MLRIVSQIIWHRKKSSLLFISIIALIVALLFSIIPLFKAVEDSIYELYANKYGEQQAIFFNITASQKEDLSKDSNIIEFGLIRNYGNWSIEGISNTLTLGSFDKNSLEIGHIRLMDGSWPSAANEIAVEQNVLHKLPLNTELGSNILLKSNKETLQFTITGIFSDYTGVWNIPEKLTKGYNDLPQAIVFDEVLANVETNIHCLVYTDTIFYGRSFSYLAEQTAARAGISSASYVTNQKLYWNTYNEKIAPLKLFENIFYFLILIGATFTVATGLSLYLNSYRDTYYKLYMLGTDMKYILRLYILQNSIILFLGVPIGVLLAYITTKAAKFTLANIPVQLFSNSALLRLSVALGIIFLLILSGFGKYVLPLQRKSISDIKKNAAIKDMAMRGSVVLSLCRSYIRNNFKKVISVLVIASLLFSAFCLSRAYFNRLYMNLHSETADFTLNPSGEAFEFYQPFELFLTKGRVFSPEQVKELYNLGGIRFLYEEYATEGAVITIKDASSPYWQSWSWYQHLSYPFEHSASEIQNAPTDVLGIDSYSYYIYVLKDDNVASFEAQYPGLLAAGAISTGSVILFLPPIKSESTILYNDILKEDDEITFSSLEYETSADEAVNNPQNIRYTEYTFQIQQVLDQDFSIEASGMELHKTVPVIVMSETTAASSAFLKGIRSIEIYLESDISQEEYTVVEQQVNILGASSLDAAIFSLRDQIAQEAIFVKTINLSLSLLFVVLGGFVLLCLFSSIYIAILRRKPSIAILRALGLSQTKLFLSIWLEVLFYLAITAFCASSVNLTATYFILTRILGVSLTMQNYVAMFAVVGLAILEALLICSIIVWLIIKNIYKESVYAAIRFYE